MILELTVTFPFPSAKPLVDPEITKQVEESKKRKKMKKMKVLREARLSCHNCHLVFAFLALFVFRERHTQV